MFHEDQSNVVDLGRPQLVDADDTVRGALDRALEALEHVEDRDAAIVRLAQRYADVIDQAEGDPHVLATFGPKLRLALESLRATPAQRDLTGGGQSDGGALARLRASRSS